MTSKIDNNRHFLVPWPENPLSGNLRDVIKENGFELNPDGCYNEYKFTFIEAKKV